VFDDLEEDGHFYDPLSKEVKEVFLPWLMDGVVERVDKVVDSMAVVDGERSTVIMRVDAPPPDRFFKLDDS
ncbi:unnamed protein product, partial [Laminaria digitata]